jgi:hypothetical protein
MEWTAKHEPDGYWYLYDGNDEGGSFCETKKADVARLIAAAPDMLAALRNAEWLLDNIKEWTSAEVIDRARDYCREAIAKATGGKP